MSLCEFAIFKYTRVLFETFSFLSTTYTRYIMFIWFYMHIVYVFVLRVTKLIFF